MSLISRLKKNSFRTIAFFNVLPALYRCFKVDAKIEVVKIVTLVFLSKFINMVVMFLPLKVLFLLSGSKNISFLYDIETKIGRNAYIGSMIAILSILYILNIILQIYKAKLVNRQPTRISKQNYTFGNIVKPYKVVCSTYAPFCQILADMLLVCFVATILFLINFYYALFFVLVVIMHSIVIEQWAFSNHQTNFMLKLKIDSKQFIYITSILLYLIFFIGIVAVVLNTNMGLIAAVLMLVLARLGNSALKSFFSCQIKLRQHFL
jgi:hypothetical protein